MTAHTKSPICYELAGESLRAALALELEIRKELETVPVKNSGNLLEIQESWDAFFKGLRARLTAENPKLLDVAGLHSPAIQVSQEKDGLPRAYRSFPEIYSSPEKNPRYFMYAPVDYNGAHFEPEGGKRLSGKREQQAGDLLFAGGWLGNAPLFSSKKTGVAVPADYVPDAEGLKSPAGGEESRAWRCFVAEGRSLAAVADFNKRTAEYRDAVEKARKLVEMLAEEEFPALLKKLPAGEALRASVSYRYGGSLEGKTELLLSVRQEGKVNFMDGGKTVPLDESRHYTLGKTTYGEYIIGPSNASPEGRILKRLIDAIPATPALSDYPELHGNFDFRQSDIEAMIGINGIVPQARELGGRTLLVYRTDDSVKSDFCPPDAKPLSTAAFLWLQADEGDRNMGITPPPMPPEVALLLPAPKKDTLAPKP